MNTQSWENHLYIQPWDTGGTWQVNGISGSVRRMYEQLRKDGVLELVAARTVSKWQSFVGFAREKKTRVVQKQQFSN